LAVQLSATLRSPDVATSPVGADGATPSRGVAVAVEAGDRIAATSTATSA
jgi:hypothetical protein